MADSYFYQFITREDRQALMRERLHQLEADHYKLDLELRLADVVGQAQLLNPQAQVALATIEAKVDALRTWLDMNERADA